MAFEVAVPLSFDFDEFRYNINALNGGFITPTSGGDPVLNPLVLPTGRNMFAINAEETPSAVAWEKGKTLVYFCADIAMAFEVAVPLSFDFDEFRFMAALIFAMAVESAPIFFAISSAFSGDIPVAFIILFILAEGLSFLSDNFAVGAATGIDDPITIILENRSFEPLRSHRELRLDSLISKPYSAGEISRIESFAEELANEKITGALYVMGIPYEKDKLKSTLHRH